MFMDHGVIDYESDDDNLNLKKRIKSLIVNSDALEFMFHCLTDIKEGKPDMDGEEREILEIWEDSPEWKEHLNSLIVRLNNEIAKKVTANKRINRPRKVDYSPSINRLKE